MISKMLRNFTTLDFATLNIILNISNYTFNMDAL